MKNALVIGLWIFALLVGVDLGKQLIASFLVKKTS